MRRIRRHVEFGADVVRTVGCQDSVARTNLAPIARTGLVSCLVGLLAACSASGQDPASHETVGQTANALSKVGGTAHFSPIADPTFDTYTANASAATKQFMNDHYYRILTYSPYFDNKTSWYGNGWFYKDAYAIYPGSSTLTSHPEWVLKDASGNKLYLPWGCGGGTCPQYAGDFGNPAFRAAWLAEAKDALAHGYKGIFVDDVNMEWRVSDGNGTFVAPIDPRTGAAMTLAAWRGYLADYMEQVRAALPKTEIVHNALWFASDSDPSVQRQTKAANFIYLERGVNDGGITGGGGQYGFDTFLSYVDHRHAAGTAVVYGGAGTSRTQCEYNLASYFLTSNDKDASNCFYKNKPDADNWWKGYDVALGNQAAPRHAWKGLLRRNFSQGYVLVNEPGNPTTTVHVPTGSKNLDGDTVSCVTLKGSQGVVLLRSGDNGDEAAEDTSGTCYAPSDGTSSSGGSTSSSGGSSSSSGGTSDGGAPSISGPSPVTAGSSVTVSWANVPAAWWNDYIILCPAGAPDGGSCIQSSKLYADSCSPTFVNSGKGTPTGSCTNFSIPASVPAGNYEYRYYRYDGWYDLQATAPVQVGPSGPSISGPSSANAGTQVTVSWANVPATWWNDYIILCPVGAADAGSCLPSSKLYADSCSPTAVDSGKGTSTGSCSNFTIPAGLSGSYEYRYYRYDGWYDLQASAGVQVQGGPQISGPSPANAGSTVTVSWSSIPAAWWNDYIVLCPAGAPDASTCLWSTKLYADSCSPTGVNSGKGTPTGSCSNFTIPAGLSGNYEYRYYRYDSWYDLQASAAVQVNAGPTISGPSPANAGSTVTVSWSSIPAAWSNDYIVLCPAGAPDASTCLWSTKLYADSCSPSWVDSGHGTPTGSCSNFTIPAGLSGNYEYRYYRYDSWYDLQASAAVQVQQVQSGPMISGPSPAAAGSTVTVSWANIPFAWSNDYIVLCPAGAPDAGTCLWSTKLYADSCSPSWVDSGHGTPTGSCSNFAIPAGLNGNYEYRYYRYDSWYDLQASSATSVR